MRQIASLRSSSSQRVIRPRFGAGTYSPYLYEMGATDVDVDIGALSRAEFLAATRVGAVKSYIGKV